MRSLVVTCHYVANDYGIAELGVKQSQLVGLKCKICKMIVVEENMQMIAMIKMLERYNGCALAGAALNAHFAKIDWEHERAAWSDLRNITAHETIHNKVFSIPDISDQFILGQQLFGNRYLLDSVSKLEEFVRAVMIERGTVVNGDKVSLTSLKGRPDRGDMGLIALIFARNRTRHVTHHPLSRRI